MAQATVPGYGSASVSDKALTIIIVGALILVALLFVLPLFNIGKGAGNVLGGAGSLLTNTGSGVGATLGGVGSAISSLGSAPVVAIQSGANVANTGITTTGDVINTAITTAGQTFSNVIESLTTPSFCLFRCK